MAAINFGYTISKPRAIDIDRNNLRKSDEILHEMPELQACIDRKSTRLNSSHDRQSRMPSSA